MTMETSGGFMEKVQVELDLELRGGSDMSTWVRRRRAA